MKQFCLGTIVAIGLALPAFGQGVDPLIGTWKLNVEKSINSQLKSATQTWTGEGQNFINTAEGVKRTANDISRGEGVRRGQPRDVRKERGRDSQIAHLRVEYCESDRYLLNKRWQQAIRLR